MAQATYSLAIRIVKDAEMNVRWCIESGASAHQIQSARTDLSAADLKLDQILSGATLAEREEMLFSPRGE